MLALARHSIRRPNFSDRPENVIIRPSANGVVRVSEGGNLTLQCYARGSPEPTYSWTRVRQLYREKITENEVKSSVYFPYIYKNMADKYECEATNVQGRTAASVILDVLCTYFISRSSMIYFFLYFIYTVNLTLINTATEDLCSLGI